MKDSDYTNEYYDFKLLPQILHIRHKVEIPGSFLKKSQPGYKVSVLCDKTWAKLESFVITEQTYQEIKVMPSFRMLDIIKEGPFGTRS